MTNEFAIKVLKELRGYGDKFANIGFDRKEALDMAIKALEQTELNPSYNGVKTELELCEDWKFYYKHGYTQARNDVLDTIRAKIIELRSKQNVGVLECLDIIDKYKSEYEKGSESE